MVLDVVEVVEVVELLDVVVVVLVVVPFPLGALPQILVEPAYSSMFCTVTGAAPGVLATSW